jgi:tRNA (adenine37-N6)-methyltransferase
MLSPPKIKEDKMRTFTLKAIGAVRADDAKGSYALEIDAPYRKAMAKLAEFGKLHAFWWADRTDDEESRGLLSAGLPYAPGVEAGVFACRSPARPNPLCVTACGVIHVDEKKGLVVLDYIDAMDGSPLVDIKPYIPVSDRARECKVPAWFRAWPEWMEDAGAFFSSENAPAMVPAGADS